jgi:hypothetical protein
MRAEYLVAVCARNWRRRAVLILHLSRAAQSVEELDAPCVRAIIMLASLRKGE